jgi:hypothetical protein
MIMDVCDIKLVDLRKRWDGRTLHKEKIAKFMESLCDVGFLQPLRVRPIMVAAGPIREIPGWEITSGRHRFEAASRLRNKGDMRFDTVPCIVIENEDERHRRMAEIDENLCRAELSPSERAKLTAERKELHEEEHPETVAGTIRARGMHKALGHHVAAESAATSFVPSTAKATGKSERSIRIDAERGAKINDKALDLISDTPLDKGVYLDQIKTVPMEKQVAVVEHDLENIKSHKPKSAGRPRKDGGETTRADEVAKWIMRHATREEIPEFKSMLQGTRLRSIMEALDKILKS